MSAQRRSLAQPAPRPAETGPAPDAAPPAHRRVAAAGLAAAAISLAADAALATASQAAFTVPASFGKFAFGTYACSLCSQLRAHRLRRRRGFFMAKLLGRVRTKMLTVGLPGVLDGMN